MPLWVVIVSLFLLASGVAISSPPATTLALVEYPQIAGTASSLLGHGSLRVRRGSPRRSSASPVRSASCPSAWSPPSPSLLAGAAYLLLARRAIRARGPTSADPAPVPATLSN